MSCMAGGNPTPSYEWRFAANMTGNPLTTFLPKARFIANGGRLLITQPSVQDAGMYQCVATNDQGTVLSSQAKLEFGFLGEFPNTTPDHIQVNAYQGAKLSCPDISGYPDIRYTWYKGDTNSIISPEFRSSIYVSSSGDLLFSTVTQADQGTYYCKAELGSLGPSTGATSRTSLPIQLVVNSAISRNFGPEFDRSDIQIAYQGGTARLECFAYGSEPLWYSWTRQSPHGMSIAMPHGHAFEFNNRTLVLPDQGFIDVTGTYQCNVYSQVTRATIQKSTSLVINDRLKFTTEISDRVEMEGDRLVWSCLGTFHSLTYVWVKDGQVIVTSPGVSVQDNTLVIDSLNVSRDAGVYQCEIRNEHGTNATTAQLIILGVGVACGQIDPSRFMTTTQRYSCSMELQRCSNEFYRTSQEPYDWSNYKNCVDLINPDDCDWTEKQRRQQLINQIEDTINMIDGPIISASGNHVGVSAFVMVTSLVAYIVTR